jgi:hypothetical protein
MHFLRAGEFFFQTLLFSLFQHQLFDGSSMAVQGFREFRELTGGCRRTADATGSRKCGFALGG